MNRWATRHRPALESALDPGETLCAADRVLLAATTVIAVGRPVERGRAVRRRGRSRALRTARARGIDLPSGAFILARTDRRLLVWRATPWLARPAALAMAMGRDRVVSVRSVGRFGLARLAVLLDDGTLLTLRPYGGRRLDHLADPPP